jgi:hypothetical protein
VTEVLCERHWEEPLVEADITRMIVRGGGCLGLHRVQWNRSLLAADGRELLCHFSSPDAESVRLAIRIMGAPLGNVWACTIRDAPGLTPDELALANVLVSARFEAPVVGEELLPAGEGAACLRTHDVRCVRTFLSTDRRRMISLCRAPDAESVRIAWREAAAPVERVWAFRQFQP